MSKEKIVVDIVCPTGGREGGIEDVIRTWTQNINDDTFDLRVMHMTPGVGYLDGYEKAYFLKEEGDYMNPSYCASGYSLLINQLGAPDICIATVSPMMSSVCDAVRKHNGLSMPVFSWVHSEIEKYRDYGHGGVREILHADEHFVINSTMAQEILDADQNAKVHNIGNPIVHEDIPSYEIPKGNTISYVGRLAEEKRLDIILEAMYRARSKWNLNIIGDGEIKNEVEGWIKLLKLDKQVKLLGWKDNPLPYIRDSIAVVAASEYEGFMISGVEALSVGKMLISTPTQGVKDYLTDSVNGYFFDFEDAQGLASILDDLYSKKREIATPETCIHSVSKYSKEGYFANVKKILLGALN
ncbi:glycosyltransferase [Butyrivibrio sp. MC2021]|uniref:glycosyltransferase n=1 Tax=Butyrivibrio sp. MC2021 TaxID=1408306 RepID=UPI00047BDA4C|nr:glycosyltransferase [Butyrivibrio sp. MC2021]